jgi:hypothetical protein
MSVPPVSSTAIIISQESSAHTLQAFIELIYVKTANDTLVAQMASLETALSTTQSAMDTLTRLQNLHNLAVVKPKGTFPSAAFGSGTTISSYKTASSAFFATPISISVSFAAVSGIAGFQTQMQAIKSQLTSEIASLSGTTPLISGREDSNSLLAKLRIVLKNINDTNAAGTLSGATAWVTDNYNKAATAGVVSAGLIQQHITNAITAGQSLNTTQTESVRNFLYLFEEYYKSASAVLQAITQIIQKMADGISR